MSKNIQTVSVKDIKEHSTNVKIYGETPVDDLVESIEHLGLLHPIVVTKDMTVIEGHRRLRALQKLKWDITDVEVLDVSSDAEILERLISSNIYRKKTNEMKIREGMFLAEARNGSARGAGKTRDIVGEAVGVSGRSFDRGVKVVKEIDKLEAIGKKEEAEKLREEMNNSIYSALKKTNDAPEEEDLLPIYHEYVHRFERLVNKMRSEYKVLAKLRNHTTPIGLGYAIGNILEMSERIATWLPKNLMSCQHCGGSKELNGEKCPYCLNGKAGLYKETDR